VLRDRDRRLGLGLGLGVGGSRRVVVVVLHRSLQQKARRAEGHVLCGERLELAELVGAVGGGVSLAVGVQHAQRGARVHQPTQLVDRPRCAADTQC